MFGPVQGWDSVAESKEVHLEQANTFTGRTIPLCDCFIVSTDATERHDGVEWLRGYHDTRGVHTSMPGMALEFLGIIDDPFGQWVGTCNSLLKSADELSACSMVILSSAGTRLESRCPLNCFEAP